MTSNFDSAGFFTTMFATLLGASIGLIGLFIQTKKESKNRYQERLTDALMRVSDRISSIYREQNQGSSMYDQENRSLGLLFASVLAIAKGDDVEMLKTLRDIAAAKFIFEGDEEHQLLTFLGEIIIYWRSYPEKLDQHLAKAAKERDRLLALDSDQKGKWKAAQEARGSKP